MMGVDAVALLIGDLRGEHGVSDHSATLARLFKRAKLALART